MCLFLVLHMDKFRIFLKNNSRFMSSIVLMIMIPFLIVLSTLWQIRAKNDFFVNEQRSKALSSGAVLANTTDIINTPIGTIKSQIQNIAKDNQGITEITILKPKTTGFTVLASTDEQKLGLTFTSEDYVKTFASNTVITSIINDNAKSPSERFLTVSAPIKDSLTGEKTGIAYIKMSLAQSDTLSAKSTSNSLIILAITIFLVLLLLVNHLRFFEYAVLFRKLNEVDKMKDDFISIASHEMKTPMAAIKGYISMMMEGLVGKFDKQTMEHLQKINTNIQRLDLLLSETLDVSRLEQGRMQFDMTPINFSDVTNQSIKMYIDQASSKGLTLTETQSTKKPIIFADPDRLQQVMDNLIGNAIKYTQKGGITVSYETKNGKLMTVIQDSGIGMNEADRKNLFTKFYRIKNEKTVDIPGTGLGLWIAREIIRKMNGDILVESIENVGSKFTIVMPYMKEE